MARSNPTTSFSECKLMKTVINNGVPAAPTITWLRRTDNSGGVTSDDVVESPFVKGFRLPLPYNANGSHKESGYVIAKARVITNAGARYTISEWGGTVQTGRFLLSSPAPRRLITAGDRERLLVKILNDIGDAKWSLGQALIEGRDAISLIGKTAKTLSDALICASRKDWRGLAKVLKVKSLKLGSKSKDAAAGWLEYSFAWNPLVDDIVGACLLLGGQLVNEKFTLMARGTFSRSEEGSSSSSEVLYGQPGGTNLTISWKDKLAYRSDLKMSLYYEVEAAHLRELQALGLLGLSTPWAVQPMSFLVDWVLPIGDVLSAIDATTGLKYLGGSYTHFDSAVATRKVTTVIPASGALMEPAEVLYNPATAFSMKRTVYDSSPIPVPSYIKDPFDAWKAVTSIALLRQFKT